MPPHDLLFLRTDITEVEGANEWVDGVLQGQIGVILAYEGTQLVGFASVIRSPTAWTRHVAEISVIVAAAVRHHGVGRHLTVEAFRAADDLGVARMLAQMTLDQVDAVNTFRALGFTPLAVLHDHVIDADGKTYDLLLMHQDVARFEHTLKRLDAGT